MRQRAADSASTRESLIAAAAALARQKGVLGLSLDRVIEAAGVSKGGLFYHFRTKEELIAAVVNAELDRFEALVERHVARGASYAGALFKALLQFVEQNSTMMGSVNAALSFGEPLRSVVLTRRRSWTARLRSESPDRNRATVVELLMDGLIFSCSHRDGPPTSAEMRRLRSALSGFSRQQAEEPRA